MQTEQPTKCFTTSAYDVVTTLGPSFFIESSALLLITRCVFERLGKKHRFIMGEMLWPH